MTNAWLLALVLTAFPSCDPAGLRSLDLHLAINQKRVEAGLRPLYANPVICEVANDRARHVALTGSPDAGIRFLDDTTRELWRRGYGPHAWAQSSLILNPGDRPLERWREVKPESYVESVHGDFEHLAIGVAAHGGRPVYSIVLGLTRATFDWRQVEPLRDLAWVRREMVARVNEIRGELGRGSVESEETLDLAALRHAHDLLANDYYSHTGLDGSTPRDRAVAVGFSKRPAIAENLAKGIFPPAEVVDRWMNSSGHRNNILNGKYTRVGHGIAYGDTEDGVEVVWVQLFGGPG